MSDQSNLCYIIDYQRNYYRLDQNNQLVVTSKDQADTFEPEDANEKIRAGRKAQFYSTIPADETLALSYDPGELDWVAYLRQFCGAVILQNDEVGNVQEEIPAENANWVCEEEDVLGEETEPLQMRTVV